MSELVAKLRWTVVGEDGARGMGRMALRYLCFVTGLLINSFGVAFITKAALGTSPISSIPYVLDLRFQPTFGEFTFVLNMVYIVAQVVLLRKDFQPIQLLQVVANLIFSAFIDVSMGLLWWLNPTSVLACAASLLLGCIMASNTLIAYPIVSRYGLQRKKSVSLSVGSSMISLLLALVTLAALVASHRESICAISGKYRSSATSSPIFPAPVSYTFSAPPLLNSEESIEHSMSDTPKMRPRSATSALLRLMPHETV